MRTFFRALRIVSAITLFFFSWTFLPLWQVVAFAATPQKSGVSSQGSGGKQKAEPRPLTAGERFEKSLDDIRQKLRWAEDKSREGVEPGPEIEVIKSRKAEIESIDSELKAEFAATEKKLKDAHLPGEILERHYKFVKHYQDNLKELVANLEQVERAGTKAEVVAAVRKAKEHLERVKTPTHHQTLDPNNLPFRARKATRTRVPRTKEQFERDFPPQRSPRSPRTAYLYEKKFGRKDAQEAQGFKSNFAIRNPQSTIRKPILVASNGPLTGLLSSDSKPETLALPFSVNSVGSVVKDFVPQSVLNLESGILNMAQAAPANAPTAADLAETPEIQFTDAIRAKAQELGSAPNIFAWVRNNIKYEPYYGSLKGAQQTLLEGAGNDFDQASLLIVLLRGINIPAKYAYGTVEIPIERVTSWLGVTDPIVAGAILSTNGIPATLMKTSSGVYKTVRLEHCWVSTFVNMLPSFGSKNNPGNMWIPLDPSFKEDKITAQIDLSKLVKFNETGYLSSRRSIPPSLSYLFSVEDYHTANYTGKIFEIFYVKRIIEENFEVFLGTLPYQIITTAQQFSEVPDTVRHKININLIDPTVGSTVMVQKNVAEITDKKITVSYNPATQEDEATISNHGGLLKTPAYLIKVKPTVKLNDSVILEGPAVNLGASLNLSVNFIEPGMSTENIETDISAGIYYCISIAALNPSQDQLSGKLDTLKSLSGTIYDSVNTRDDQIGELLHGISIEYFSKANNAARSLAALMHMQNTNVTSGSFVSVRVSYANVFGIPLSPATIAGLNLDVQRYMQSPFSITGDNDQRKEFVQIQGLNSSFFEHSIMEMIAGLESISTVKALQIANETGVPIYTITTSNINDVLPGLTVLQEVKTDIQNAINAGKEVTISRDNVRLNDWTGVGFIVRDPNTGGGAYMISGGTGGTDTTQPASGSLMLLSRSIAVLAEGSPNNTWLSIADLDLWEADMHYLDNIGGMLLGHGYVPIVVQAFTKRTLIDFANRGDDRIFYYSGHGGEGYMTPLPPASWFGYSTNAEREDVFPRDIDAHTRITFLNSCSSAKNLDFMFAFHAQVFLGWNDEIGWQAGGEFGFNWWRNMNDGFTAEDAATRQGTKFTNYNTLGPKIYIEGNTETTLH